MTQAVTATKKVLVIDDDPVVGKSFARVLSGKGYAVITAKDGQEALDKLASESYDLVYTDIKMPGMSGLEVAEPAFRFRSELDGGGDLCPRVGDTRWRASRRHPLPEADDPQIGVMAR